VTGGLVPLNVVFITFAEGDIKLGELPSFVVEGAFQGIRSFFIDGALAIYTWLIAGALFGVGAWVIDRFNSSPSLAASKYGTWVVTLLLGLLIVVIAVLGPPETLRNFG
jgi:cell division protein FtsX